MRALLAGLLLAALAAPAPGRAPGDLCRAAARAAAERHGLPDGLLEAIALVETGTTRGGARGPWPWTLNIEGEGRWFDSRAEARRAAEAAIRAGRTSTDIGCFQINWRWHGEAFESVDAVLEPALGADYAARFLKGLAAEAGDWMTAAGWYHSRTEAHATRYRALVARLFEGGAPPPEAAPAAPRPAPGPAAPGGVRLTSLTPARGILLGIGN